MDIPAEIAVAGIGGEWYNIGQWEMRWHIRSAGQGGFCAARRRKDAWPSVCVVICMNKFNVMAKIKVENVEISVIKVGNDDYISLTDMVEIEFYCRECERSHWSVRERVLN